MDNAEFQRDISPITKTKSIVYCKYRIVCDKVYFMENKADFIVLVSDETGENVKQFFYTISGNEYLNWQSDSSVREIIKQKLRNEVF